MRNALKGKRSDENQGLLLWQPLIYLNRKRMSKKELIDYIEIASLTMIQPNTVIINSAHDINANLFADSIR